METSRKQKVNDNKHIPGKFIKMEMTKPFSTRNYLFLTTVGQKETANRPPCPMMCNHISIVELICNGSNIGRGDSEGKIVN